MTGLEHEPFCLKITLLASMFIGNSQLESFLLTSAIIQVIFFQMLNIFFLSVEFPQKISPHYRMELKYVPSWVVRLSS
jgi:hypothetical protein